MGTRHLYWILTGPSFAVYRTSNCAHEHACFVWIQTVVSTQRSFEKRFEAAGKVAPRMDVANWQVWSTLTGASCLLIAGMSSFLASWVHPHGPPASSLQVCRLFFLQVWPILIGASCLIIAGTVRRLSLQVYSTLTGASCLLIAGVSSFILAGLVRPHRSFLPPHCR